MSFSDNIIKIRKENNLTQEQLAEELNVSRQAISKWERGIGYPEMEKILYICKKYNKSLDELFSDEIGANAKKNETDELTLIGKGFFEQLSDWWANQSVSTRKILRLVGILFAVVLLCNLFYGLGYDIGKFIFNITH